MPLVPEAPTIASAVSTTTELNQFRDAIRYLQTPPTAKLWQTAAQSLTSGVATAITFNAEEWDTDVDNAGGHDNSTNNSRWICRYPGKYWVAAGIGYASNATGLRTVEIAVNGVLQNGSGVLTTPVTGATTRVAGRGYSVGLTIGDYIEVYGFQNSGGALNTAVSATEQPTLVVMWVSR